MSNEVDFWDVEKYAEELRYASLDEAVRGQEDEMGFDVTAVSLSVSPEREGEPREAAVAVEIGGEWVTVIRELLGDGASSHIVEESGIARCARDPECEGRS